MAKPTTSLRKVLLWLAQATTLKWMVQSSSRLHSTVLS